MSLDRYPGDATRETSLGRRWIHPAVMIALDEDTEPLGPRSALALGRRHAAALPFLCTLPSSVPRRGRPALEHAVRLAFETVTDLGARETAILTGHEIEDAIRVYFTLFLGGQADERRIADTVEAAHRVALDFFDRTRIEVHGVVLLPDLAAFEDRQARYAAAYRQISALDRLGDPARSLGQRKHAPTDFRWILDSRTRTGAHAGELDDVLDSVAETIALLLEGRRTEPITRVADAADRLAATVHGRIAGYSTFGAALVEHRRHAIARLLTAEAALALLADYGNGHELFKKDESADSLKQSLSVDPNGPGDEEAIESAAAEWANSTAVLDRLERVFEQPPPARDAPADEQDRFQALQRRRFQKAMTELEAELGQAVTTWLDGSGLAAAAATLHLLQHGELEEALSPTATTATLPALRRRIREDLERFLEVRVLRARVQALFAEETDLRKARKDQGRANREHENQEDARRADARADEYTSSKAGEGSTGANDSPDDQTEGPRGSAGDSNGDPAGKTNGDSDGDSSDDSIMRLASERKALEVELRRREAMLVPGYDLDRLETELVAIVAEPSPWPRPADAATGEHDSPRAAPPNGHSIRARLARGVRWLQRLTSRPPAPLPEAASQPSRETSARTLIERLRWIEGYATVLDRVHGALDAHAEAVQQAAAHYERATKSLTDAVLHRTNFVHPSTGPAGLQRYRATYLADLRDALGEHEGGRLSSHFRLDPVKPKEFEHPLNVALAGFEDTLHLVSKERLAPLLAESIDDVLAGRTPAGPLGELHNVARMLLEASEPLARPAPLHDDAPAAAALERWVLASNRTIEVLQADAPTVRILEEAKANTLAFPDETAIVFFSTTHGFSAQALRKLLTFRAESLRDGYGASGGGDAHGDGARSAGTDPAEPVSLEALAHGPAEPALRALVLARRLGVLQEDGDRLRLDDEIVLPGDLVEAVRELTSSTRAQPAQRILEDRLDEVLQQSDGLERLRRAGEDPMLADFERRVIAETLLEVLSPQADAPRSKLESEPA